MAGTHCLLVRYHEEIYLKKKKKGSTYTTNLGKGKYKFGKTLEWFMIRVKASWWGEGGKFPKE
jgi:hypothetical protein